MERTDPVQGAADPCLAPEPLSPWRRKADRYLAGLIETFSLLLVCLSPWALGTVSSCARLTFYGGLAALLALWGGRLLLQGQLVWHKCSVTAGLAAAFLLGSAQITAFPPSVLRAVAPSTANFYERVTPAQMEVLSDGTVPTYLPRQTLSLDARATRAIVMDLLAIFLLFAVVRNNVPSLPGLRRLSIVLTANGTLLAIVVLLQASLPGLAAFSNGLDDGASALSQCFRRENCGGYILLSVGLAVGLILHFDHAVISSCSRRLVRVWVSLAAAVVLMLGGLAWCCLPEDIYAIGAAVSLASLILVCSRRRACLPAVGALTCLAIVAGVLASDPGNAPWLLAQAKEFPFWGTGLGTFDLVAANIGMQADLTFMVRSTPSVFQVLLVETGVVGLTVALVVIGLVLRQGVQVCRQATTNATCGLAIGVVFGVTTVLVGSIFAGNLCSPAVAVPAAIMCAHLCGLAISGDGSKQVPVETSTIVIRLFGIAAPAGMAMLLVLGLALIGHARRASTVEQFVRAAAQLRGSEDAADTQRRLQYLQAAMSLAPGSVPLRLKLADAHHQLLEEKSNRLHSGTRFLAAPLVAQAWATSGLMEVGHNLGHLVVAWWLPVSWPSLVGQTAEHLEKQHLRPYLVQTIEARNASPIVPETHLRLAQAVLNLKSAEPPKAYRARAKWLAPGNAWVYYQCGVQEAGEGDLSTARASWRRSLELSDGCLTAILDRCRDDMTSEQMLQGLLADRPEQLMSAAAYLYPNPLTSMKPRRPFLERTLGLLAKKETWSAGDYCLAGRAHFILHHSSDGRAAFERALAIEPRQTSWRYEYARFLYHEECLSDAERQLLTILDQQPEQKRAREFLQRIRERVGN